MANFFKSAGKALGGIAKLAAPIVGAIPGVGSLAGGALGGVGSILSGGSMGDHLRGALGGALGGVTSALGSRQGEPEAITGVIAGSPDGSTIGRITDWLKGNSGKNALGVAQGINTAIQSTNAQKQANRALKGMEREAEERAPLRSMGVSGLLREDTGNPYARGY